MWRKKMLWLSSNVSTCSMSFGNSTADSICFHSFLSIMERKMACAWLMALRSPSMRWASCCRKIFGLIMSCKI